MENRENTLATIEEVKQNWSQEQIDTIRKTVALNASPEELNMFLSLAYSYNLDPFMHEIWFVNMGGRNTIITGRDGYLKIANCNKHYKGMYSDVVYSNDKFLKDDKGIHHAYNMQNRGQIIGAYAEVYRDDRDVPAYFFAPMANYYKNSGVWRQYPQAMIQKVAEAAALKRAFSISGLVTEEEVITAEEVKPEAPKSPVPDKYRQQTKQRIWAWFLKRALGDKQLAQNAILSLVYGKPSAQWDTIEIETLCGYMMDHETESYLNGEFKIEFSTMFPPETEETTSTPVNTETTVTSETEETTETEVINNGN